MEDTSVFLNLFQNVGPSLSLNNQYFSFQNFWKLLISWKIIQGFPLYPTLEFR